MIRGQSGGSWKFTFRRMRSGHSLFPPSKFTRRNVSDFSSAIGTIATSTSSNLPQLSLIGDFHSHTGWGDLRGVGIPSTQDIIDMSPEHLNIILVVNDKRRASAWQYNGDGTLSGTVDDYHFRIGGYYLDEYSRVKRANIFCPYAIGFNAKESQQKVLLRSASAHQRWLRSKR